MSSCPATVRAISGAPSWPWSATVTPGCRRSRSRARLALSAVCASQPARPPGSDSTHSMAAPMPATVTVSSVPPSKRAAVAMKSPTTPCSRFQVARRRRPQRGRATPGTPTGRRCPAGRAATSGRRRRRSRRRWRPRRRRSRRPTGRRPAAATLRPRARPRRSRPASSTRPVVHSTCETATIRVSSPIAVQQPSGGSSTTRTPCAAGDHVQRAADARVLLGRGQHLVAGLPVDARR